jgi:dipeptidyl aminopeptidase/acylaminoacyl peptidase
MSIFELTYLSDELPVKAYLGIPSAIRVQRDGILTLLMQRYGRRPDLAVEVVEGVEDEEKDRVPVNDSLPGLVYCRGGINRVGMAKIPWIKDFMARGYAVIAPWYRGTYGNPGRDQFGGADCNDVLEAYRLLQSMPFVQANAISALGFSRGSINATKLTIAARDVHHLILWGGVADLAWTYEERIELRRMLKRVVGGSPTKVPDAYQQRSPARLAQDIPCPVLIVHGTADVQVPFRHAILMSESLRAHGKPFTVHAYEGYGHHLPPDVHQAVIDRMLEHVAHGNPTSLPH